MALIFASILMRNRTSVLKNEPCHGGGSVSTGRESKGKHQKEAELRRRGGKAASKRTLTHLEATCSEGSRRPWAEQWLKADPTLSKPQLAFSSSTKERAARKGERGMAGRGSKSKQAA